MTYRHGKGQTYIEPFIDTYTRCRVKWNLIFTDPKGELLAKFYYSLSKRQYEVVQFNLLNPNLTNQFNPLINALQEFRQNNDVEGMSQVDSLANIIFVESENSKGVKPCVPREWCVSSQGLNRGRTSKPKLPQRKAKA